MHGVADSVLCGSLSDKFDLLILGKLFGNLGKRLMGVI